MYTEYSIVNYDREGQKIEHVSKVLPYGRRAVLSYAFGVKSVALQMVMVKNQSLLYEGLVTRAQPESLP